MEADRRMRVEMGERLETVSISIEALAAKESAASDRMLRELLSVQIKLNTANDTIRRN